MNEVLEMCDIPAVVGHAAHNAPTSFTPVREANVIILEDSEIDLYAYSLAEVMVTRKPSLTVAGKSKTPLCDFISCFQLFKWTGGFRAYKVVQGARIGSFVSEL